MVIDLVVGARPNFIKAAAILKAAKAYPEFEVRLIHTGQHRDDMSDPFFSELGLPMPIRLHTSVVPNGARFGLMVCQLEAWFRSHTPHLVMVVGDTDSTAAGAIAAIKAKIPVVHVEAGLRCGDRKMQEELNRSLVDSISSLCFTTTMEAKHSLVVEENHPYHLVYFVGNVMIDTLFDNIALAKQKYPIDGMFDAPLGRYAVATIHRAENVDTYWKLRDLLDAVNEISKYIPVVFPMHPRVSEYKMALSKNVIACEPKTYLQFISLLSEAEFVMTDSGGVQEETTALGIPCLTLRESTERPETISNGTNKLVGTKTKNIIDNARKLIGTPVGTTLMPKMWDGHAAERLMRILSCLAPTL